MQLFLFSRSQPKASNVQTREELKLFVPPLTFMATLTVLPGYLPIVALRIRHFLMILACLCRCRKRLIRRYED